MSAAPSASPATPASPEPIVLYDGVCGLCHRSVQFLIARDRGQLRYAPLQGETTARLRARYPEIPDKLSTVVLIADGRVRLRSKAFLYAARYLTRPWRWAYYLRWLPSFLIDLPYRLIARLRYRIWGRYDSCRRPTADDLARLLP